MLERAFRSDTAESTDQMLIKLGGVAAWLVALLTLSEVILFAIHPQPGTVSDWFALFQSSRLLGLLECRG